MGAWALKRGPGQNTTAFTTNTLVVRYILNSETLTVKKVVEICCKDSVVFFGIEMQAGRQDESK